MIFTLILIAFLLNSLVYTLQKKKSLNIYCGLAAFSGTSNYDPDLLKFLLYYNSKERKSEDSTGFWSPINGINKDAISAKQFLQQTSIKEDTIFIGHARSKTKGCSTRDSAHPFKVLNIVGAHNGTISNHLPLLRERGIPEVAGRPDSYAIVQCLAHDGNPRVFREIFGAAAFIFTDTSKEEKTLYVYRNDERPLYRGIRPEGMYIASEAEALQIIECKTILPFSAGYFYTIVNGKITEYYPLMKIETTSAYSSELKDEKAEKLVDNWVILLKDTKFTDEFHVEAAKTVKAGSAVYVTDYKKLTSGSETTYIISLEKGGYLEATVTEKDLAFPEIMPIEHGTPLIAVFDISGTIKDKPCAKAGDLLACMGVPYDTYGTTKSKAVRVRNVINKEEFAICIEHTRFLFPDELHKLFPEKYPDPNAVETTDTIAEKVFSSVTQPEDKLSAVATKGFQELAEKIEALSTDLQVKSGTEELREDVEVLKKCLVNFATSHKKLLKETYEHSKPRTTIEQ